MTAQFKLADLQNFRGGSEQFYRHSLTSALYSEGVKYVAETASAYWLIDQIATLQMEPNVRREEFQVWKLFVTPHQEAILSCDDGNGNIVHSVDIPYTDFPEPGVKIWYADGVIYLPEEH